MKLRNITRKYIIFPSLRNIHNKTETKTPPVEKQSRAGLFKRTYYLFFLFLAVFFLVVFLLVVFLLVVFLALFFLTGIFLDDYNYIY